MRWVHVCLVLLPLPVWAACGNISYALRVTRASDALARAEQLDAAARAPYEYHFALEHLKKARSEAASADFGDAERLASVALEYANRAVQLAQRVEPVVPARPAGAP
jgi:Domain of unknown function (DUF4398)